MCCFSAVDGLALDPILERDCLLDRRITLFVAFSALPEEDPDFAEVGVRADLLLPGGDLRGVACLSSFGCAVPMHATFQRRACCS